MGCIAEVVGSKDDLVLCLDFAYSVDDFVDCSDPREEMFGWCRKVIGLFLEDKC